MAIARALLVDPSVTRCYRCINRCVQWADLNERPLSVESEATRHRDMTSSAKSKASASATP
jgi:hypothetical protein